MSVLNNLALSYSKSGQIEKAIEMHEEVVKMKTGFAEIHPLTLSVCAYDTLLFVKYQPTFRNKSASVFN